LIYRLNSLIYANRAFLDWTGYSTLDELTEAGGLDSLFIEPKKEAASKDPSAAKSLTIATSNGKQKPVEGRLFSVTWSGESALALMIETQPGAGGKQAEISPQRGEEEIRELRAILDTATDGVLILDSSGRVLSGNRSAQALFGYDAGEMGALSLSDLVPIHRPVLEHLSGLPGDGVGSLRRLRAIGRVCQAALSRCISHRRIEDGEKLRGIARRQPEAQRRRIDQRQTRAEKASTAKPNFAIATKSALAQCHHRLFRSDDGRTFRPDRQRTLPAISQGHPRLGRASYFAPQRFTRSVEDRSRKARAHFRERQSQ
jgi:PAS domain-containing protein